MQNISERYRLKALACEKLGREEQNDDLKSAWAEIAIEWHALASRAAPASNQGRQMIEGILGSWPIKEVKKLVEEMEAKIQIPN